MSDIDKTKESTIAAPGADFSTYIHIDSITDNTGTNQGVVADGGLTDDLQPTLSGYLPEAQGLQIRVFLNGSVVGYTVVRNDGNWSYTPETPLIAGTENTFQVVLMDSANGNTLWLSNEYNIITTEPNQDGGIPPAPEIKSVVDDVKGYNGFTGALHNGDATNDARPTLSGTATAGSTVNIYADGNVIGSTTTAADGSWKFTPDKNLTDGTHALTANVVTAGGESAPTDAFTITVDTVISKPVIDSVTDNQGNTQGNVVDGGKTDDSQPVLTGHAEANSRVDIHVFGPNGKQLYYQSVHSDADGNWSYQPKEFTTQGAYSFGISGIDHVGNAWTDFGHKYTIEFVGSNQDSNDTTPPAAPVITNAYDDVGVRTGNVVNGGKTDDDKLKLTGTAEADSTVTISHIIQSTGQSYTDGTVVADANGHWTFDMVKGFQDVYSNRIFTATATDTAGNTSSESSPYIVNYVRSNQDTNFSSGYEDFENYAGQYWYNEFTTQSGLHFIGTQPNSSAESIGHFNNDSQNHGQFLTFAQGKADHLTVELPGIAKELSFDYTYASGHEYVTLYNADGNKIGSSRLDSLGTTDSGLTQTWHTFSFSAPGDSEIAYFTVTQTDSYENTRIYMDNIKWTSPDTQEKTQDYSMHVNQYDVTNNTQDTLQLSLNDILNEMHPNLFIQDGKQQMAVTGDAGDVVELKVEDLAHNTWQDTGTVTAGGIQYEVYQHTGSDVELLVQHGLELHQVS
ncbi:Ig-like domain-containing protein [Rahnella ecdela]|uniref:Bacterial Ig-like domain-containing protein n=1 Tax=Rahnella ecdela TaxID=2816250 RepID=A0ABS6L9Z0_9GAMM|nr:Ig-like domain-containing protein [Rahnella ecdela]MBU9843760.1 hypothetical protein [Rahnella ecdela]